ncbi:MAG: hypothetical protein KBA51_04220 [Kiritimatiellae bacterium]|nr:hypothetical protein [Kiritimatiellia bacterium]
MVTGRAGTIWAVGFILPSVIFLISPFVEHLSPGDIVGGSLTLLALVLPPLICGWAIFAAPIAMSSRIARFLGTLGLLFVQWCILVLLVLLWCTIGPGNLLKGTQ